MSEPTREASNTTVTIWFKRKTGYGQGSETTWDAVVTQACYKKGGSREFVDSTGVRFIPRSTYWFEVLAENPRITDFIALGDQSLITNPSDADGAEEIRTAELQDCSLIDDVDDFMVMT